MTNVLQHLGLQITNILVPPGLVLRGLVLPLLHLELTQLGGEVHQSYGDHLRLPLQTQSGAQTVVDEGPGHLNHLVQLGLVSLQTLGIPEDGGVGMIHLQVELYCL